MTAHPEAWRERIHSDPEIMGERLVVRGSRVTVDYILGLLAGRPNPAEAAAEFCNAERADVLAAGGFAAYILREHPDIARRLAAAGGDQHDGVATRAANDWITRTTFDA